MNKVLKTKKIPHPNYPGTDHYLIVNANDGSESVEPPKEPETESVEPPKEPEPDLSAELKEPDQDKAKAMKKRQLELAALLDRKGWRRLKTIAEKAGFEKDDDQSWEDAIPDIVDAEFGAK